MVNDLDVLIVGGGPAGSAAATLLAHCGHRVLIVERPVVERHAVAESIPPSAKKTLSALGLLNAVDAAGFHPWTGNTVWWADAEPRVERFAPGEFGYQVERSHFDAVLRGVAEHAGAVIRHGLVRDVDDDGTAIVEADGVTTRVTARFVLDCSGRAGVIARKWLRRMAPSLRTVALSCVWRADSPWPDAERTHTLVASYTDGWAWSVPLENDVRHVTVMVDPERTHLTRGAPAREVYLAELAKVRPFAPWLASASLVDGPWGADASPYSARQYSGPGFLLVGDAGAAIDPLSSFGVKKALASAWLAGIAVNTAIRTPSMREEAFAFFDRREREVHAAFQQQSAAFAVNAAAGTQHPFWQTRATSADAIEADEAADPAALARDPAVLAALADLQRRPAIHLQPGPDARIATAAAVRGHEIVMDEHLVLPAWPAGVRYLRNIDLLLLSRLATEHRDVGALYEALFRAQPGASLPDFLGALATLVARGGLIHAE